MQNEKSVVAFASKAGGFSWAADTATQKLFRLEGQNLASPVVPARWAGSVRRDSAAALRAFV